MLPKLDAKKTAVFFDFDNTITTFDVIDDMLVRFSRNEKWKDLEEEWRHGKIGSRECLDGQIRGIRLTKRGLDRYLTGIQLDRHFKPLVRLLRDRGARIYIVSDNFEYLLRRVLRRNGLGSLPVYANRLTFRGDRLIPGFPLHDTRCRTCAHCKKSTLVGLAAQGTTTIYIGDGLSDAHPSRRADMVFAKDALKEYCAKHMIAHTPFTRLKDVYDRLKKELS